MGWMHKDFLHVSQYRGTMRKISWLGDRKETEQHKQFLCDITFEKCNHFYDVTVPEWNEGW